MLKHIVLLPFKAGVKTQLVEEIFAILDSLKQILPGMMLLSYGTNQRSLTEHHGYSHAYSIDFVDEEYYHHFIRHEKQAEIREKLRIALEPGKEALVVNYHLG